MGNDASYVCNLPEEREAFSHGYEKENKHLIHEFKELQCKQGNFSFCKNVILILKINVTLENLGNV